MSVLSKDEIQNFNEQGFVICRGLLDETVVQQVWHEIETIFRDQAAKFGLCEDPDVPVDDVIRMVMKPDSEPRGKVYDFVRFIPSVRRIQTSEKVNSVLKALGLEFPICMDIPTIRFDMPDEKKFLRGPHQDLGAIHSPKCVTVWFPFVPVSKENGSLGVFPGSHKQGLLEHYIEDEHGAPGVQVKNDIPLGEEVIVDAKPGDIAFLNSFCVHRSYPGTSGQIKINGQFFYNDALEVRMGDQYQVLAGKYDALRTKKNNEAKSY